MEKLRRGGMKEKSIGFVVVCTMELQKGKIEGREGRKKKKGKNGGDWS